MQYKFAVTIQDKKSAMTPKKGIDMEELGVLVMDMKKAIDAKDGSNITLYDISNHGYTPNFVTDSKQQYQNYVSVHQNIFEKPLEDLRPKEAKYAQTLKNVLHHGRHLESFGLRSKPIAKIYPGDIEKSVETYNSITNIDGIVSEMGAPDINLRTHVFLSGHDYKIYTNPQQDDTLKSYYRQLPLSLKVKQKVSIRSGRIISAILIDISPKTPGNFVENIQSLTNDDLSFLKNSPTHQDILNLIRT